MRPTTSPKAQAASSAPKGGESLSPLSLQNRLFCWIKQHRQLINEVRHNIYALMKLYQMYLTWKSFACLILFIQYLLAKVTFCIWARIDNIKHVLHWGKLLRQCFFCRLYLFHLNPLLFEFTFLCSHGGCENGNAG